MSVGSRQETVQKTDPAQLAMLTGNYNAAKPIAAGLSQPYSGALVAPNSPGQVAAQGAYTDIANNTVGAAPLNSAIDATTGFLNFKPTQVDAGQVGGMDLSKYMNPYTDGVINSSLGDLERQRQIAGVNDNQRATASHAFGGSRQGVADSLTNDAYDRNAGSLIAGLRSSGYQSAIDTATGDVNRKLTADTTNQGAGIAGANLGLSAATNLAGQSEQQLNQAGQRAGFLSQVGDAQQAQDQAGLTANYQEFLRQIMGTQQGQQLLNSALGLFPAQGTSTTTGQQSLWPSIIGAAGKIGSAFAMPGA